MNITQMKEWLKTAKPYTDTLQGKKTWSAKVDKMRPPQIIRLFYRFIETKQINP
jgi:hypothetical protein